MVAKKSAAQPSDASRSRKLQREEKGDRAKESKPPPPSTSKQPQQSSQPTEIEGEPATGGVASDIVSRDYTK
eukprot:4537024-Amphidinium_carterae.1